MAFKKIESKIGYAELALSSSMDKNRTLRTLEQMNNVIDWSRIEKILKKYYKVGFPFIQMRIFSPAQWLTPF